MHNQSRAEEKFVRTSCAVSRNQYRFGEKGAGGYVHSSVWACLSAASNAVYRQFFQEQSRARSVGFGWTNKSADEE
jgi:hypothetical protein